MKWFLGTGAVCSCSCSHSCSYCVRDQGPGWLVKCQRQCGDDDRSPGATYCILDVGVARLSVEVEGSWARNEAECIYSMCTLGPMIPHSLNCFTLYTYGDARKAPVVDGWAGRGSGSVCRPTGASRWRRKKVAMNPAGGEETVQDSRRALEGWCCVVWASAASRR